jgi:hypothetical protein
MDIEQASTILEASAPNLRGRRLKRVVKNAYTLYFYPDFKQDTSNPKLSHTYVNILRGHVLVPPFYTEVPSAKCHDPENVSILKL